MSADLTTIGELDRIIHEPARMRILALLSPTPNLSFTEIKEALKLTDGNLSVHLRTLEEAGYISVTREFVGRKPRSEYAMTTSGCKAFAAYIDALEQIVRETRSTEPASVQVAIRLATAE